jgi:3-hydroxyisobutyrate dehydrogenase-like beta-hydroxyacid dehydrogenase
MKIGFIGLGIMGSRMAANLQKTRSLLGRLQSDT